MLQGFKEDKYILVVQSKTNTDLVRLLSRLLLEFAYMAQDKSRSCVWKQIR